MKVGLGNKTTTFMPSADWQVSLTSLGIAKEIIPELWPPRNHSAHCGFKLGFQNNTYELTFTN